MENAEVLQSWLPTFDSLTLNKAYNVSMLKTDESAIACDLGNGSQCLSTTLVWKYPGGALMLTGKYMLLIIKANIVVITHVIAYLSHTYGMQISKRLWGWAL